MQNFDRFQRSVQEFESSSKAADFQAIAGGLIPLVEELCVPLTVDESVESLKTLLRDVMKSDPRVAKSMKAQVVSQLRMLQRRIEIQRDKDDWRRDDA